MSRNLAGCEVENCTLALKLLRIQRHDFMNHLQIIHTTIQMGRTQKAIEYIEKISNDQSWIDGIMAEYNKNEKM